MSSSPTPTSLIKLLKWIWRNLAMLSLGLLCLLLLFIPIIANDIPLWVHTQEHSFSPLLSPTYADQLVEEKEDKTFFTLGSYDWSAFQDGSYIWPIVPYSHTSNTERIPAAYPPLHPNPTFSKLADPPLLSRHWLGSSLGVDLLASILYGSRNSLIIVLGAGFLSLVLASLIGGLAVYFKNKPFHSSLWDFGWIILGLLGVYFWTFYSRQHLPSSLQETASKLLITCLIIGIWWIGKKVFKRIPFSFFQPSIRISLDFLILKLIEVLNTFPALMLIISLSIFFGNDVWDMVLILSLLGWTGLARIIRTEAFKLSTSGFIRTAEGLGISPISIFFRHYLPNMVSPLILPMSSSLKVLLLVESSLSYLNIGLASNQPSLGRLIATGTTNLSDWWTILFPGLTLCFLILTLHIIGEKIRDWVDPFMVPEAENRLI